MREIKFKAWIGNMNCWADEVTVYSDGSWSAKIGAVGGYSEQDGGILVQYIDLKDVKDVEIFKGDIVAEAEQDWCDDGKWKVNTYRGPWEVKWAKGYAGPMFCGFDSKGDDYDFYGGIPRDCIVIGNIYENSELLK